MLIIIMSKHKINLKNKRGIKMDVFWQLYCSLDESGRKKLLARYFEKQLNGTFNREKVAEAAICLA